ncbi:MAG: hypothetical protein K1Y01_16870 [Vicinamibacteria bacterium]|nr:hypothetical protein [Vicinamibacteria bacterium]
MARRTGHARRAFVALGLTALLGAKARGEQNAPCRPGDSLLSLGKAAFFKSIERGAFAIGERTLDDLLDGLGGASRPSGGARRAQTTAPAQARAAVFPRTGDEILAGALQAYVDAPSSEAADAAFEAFLETATRILFETPPDKPGEFGRVGLVLEDKNFSNRGSTFAVKDMVNEGRRRGLEDSLFGGESDIEMGKANRLLATSPFFKAPVIADTRNVDRNNLGIAVKREADLRALWFEDYRAYLATTAPAPSPAQITEALNAGWPILQKFWAFKRTEIFVDRAQTAFGTQMREVYDRVTREGLPTRDCEPKAR